MKFAYITRVTIPNKVAQAAQITSMCKAFDDYLGDQFLLVSPGKEIENFEELKFNREIIKIKTVHKVLRNIVFALKITFFLRKSKVDYIYTRDILIAFIATFFYRIQTGYEAHQPVRSKVAKIIQKLVGKNAQFKLVTITQSLKEYYGSNFSYKNEIHVVPNGVYFNDYQIETSKNDLRKELDIPIDEFVIVHTGSLFQNRGFEKFEVILANFPKVKLIQLGGKKGDIEILKQKLKAYNNIEFIEYQPKSVVIKYQKAADLLLYLTSDKSPIYWCTSPNKIFEYMATKNPILAPSIGSILEILNEGNSYTFELKNDEEMIQRIKEIMSATSDERPLKAFKEVQEIYNMDNRVKTITNILKN